MVVHGPYPIGEPRVAREASAAVRAGFAVDVIAAQRPGEPARESDRGVRIFRLPIARRRGTGALATAREFLGFSLLASRLPARLDRVERYCVVHVHNPPDFLLLAALIPRLRGARVLLDVHDLAPDMFEMRFGRHRFWRIGDSILRAIEGAALRLADEVVTVHEPYRRELLRRGAGSERVTVVMNAIDEELLPETVPRPSAEPFRIVYHGTITPPYGVEVLTNAMSQIIDQLPDARLELIGEGDAVPAVRAIIAARSLENNVLLTEGYLDHVTVLQHVAGASVGVIPNLRTQLSRYALSSKLFEYVALGVPVVCARLPTFEEHFDDREVRFFEPGDPESLAEAILSISSDFEAAIARATAALDRYQQYRWRPNNERYVAVLERLAARSRRVTDELQVQ